MIICRIFIGAEDSIFRTQGVNDTYYVIDELAIKAINKHDNITGSDSNVTSDQLVHGAFRSYEGYDLNDFIAKFVRPVILIRPQAFSNINLHMDPIKLTDKYMMAVSVPDKARSIPMPSWGFLVPNVEKYPEVKVKENKEK